MERFNLAVVGCGDIGWVNAMASIQSKIVRPTVVFDPNIYIAQELARKTGARCADSFEAILEDRDVHGILLSTPHHLHVPQAIAAAKAGKHLLVEKPLANDTKGAREIIAACRQYGVKLSVNYSFRFSAVNEAARELVNAGALGEIAGVAVSHLIQKGKAYWSGGYFGRTMDNWRCNKEKAGGGILIMGLVHSLDYMQHVLGQRIVQVYADYGNNSSPGDVEDYLSLVCRFERGAVGNWCAATCYAGAPVIQERIWGSKGAFTVKPEPCGVFLKARHGDMAPGKFRKLALKETSNPRALWFDDVALAVAENREPRIGASDAWNMTALVEAAYRSRDTGKAVAVPTMEQPQDSNGVGISCNG